MLYGAVVQLADEIFGAVDVKHPRSEARFQCTQQRIAWQTHNVQAKRVPGRYPPVVCIQPGNYPPQPVPVQSIHVVVGKPRATMRESTVTCCERSAT